MNIKINQGKSLRQLAALGNFNLPAKVTDVIVTALETDHEQAGPGSLTFVSGSNPASVYRCRASAILVIRPLAQIIPRDEGEVIPVSNPEKVFDKLLEELG